MAPCARLVGTALSLASGAHFYVPFTFLEAGTHALQAWLARPPMALNAVSDAPEYRASPVHPQPGGDTPRRFHLSIQPLRASSMPRQVSLRAVPLAAPPAGSGTAVPSPSMLLRHNALPLAACAARIARVNDLPKMFAPPTCYAEAAAKWLATIINTMKLRSILPPCSRNGVNRHDECKFGFVNPPFTNVISQPATLQDS